MTKKIPRVLYLEGGNSKAWFSDCNKCSNKAIFDQEIQVNDFLKSDQMCDPLGPILYQGHPG